MRRNRRQRRRQRHRFVGTVAGNHPDIGRAATAIHRHHIATLGRNACKSTGHDMPLPRPVRYRKHANHCRAAGDGRRDRRRCCSGVDTLPTRVVRKRQECLRRKILGVQRNAPSPLFTFAYRERFANGRHKAPTTIIKRRLQYIVVKLRHQRT